MNVGWGMLKVSAEKLGSVAALHLEGRIVNGDATRILRDAVLGQAEACAVVLDLANVDLVDAGGLGVLMELRQWTQTRGIEFRLINVNRLVKQVLAITRLDSVLKISARAEVQSVTAGDQIGSLLENACV
jgi:anti-anti-sigma factor